MSTEIIKLERSQSNCTVKNEKGQFCAGHLKEFMTAPDSMRRQLLPNHQLYRCKRCQAVYMSPAQLHLQPGKTSTVLPPQTNEEPEILNGSAPTMEKPKPMKIKI